MIKEINSPAGNQHEVRVEYRARFDCREEALRAERMVRGQIQKAVEALSYGLSPCVTILGGLKDFLRHQRRFENNCAPTLAHYQRALKFFARELSRGAGDISLDRIAVTELQILCEKLAEGGFGRKYADATINKYLAALFRYGRWAVERRLVPQNTTLHWLAMKKIRIPKRQYQVLTEAQLRRLLRQWPRSGRHVLLVILAMAFTGARPVVLLELKWKQLELTRTGGYFPLRRIKNGDLCAVSFEAGSSIHRLLQYARAEFARLRGRPPRREDFVFVPKWGRAANAGGWTPAAFSNAVRHHTRKLREFRAYDIMHAITTLLTRKKVGDNAIMNFRGHTSTKTQQIYIHTSGEDGKEARQVVDDVFGKDLDRAMGRKPERTRKPRPVEELEMLLL